MEAINAVGLTPLSVLSDRFTESRKRVAFHAIAHVKNCPNVSYTRRNISEGLSRRFRGGLVLLSSILGSGLAKALTYEEALEQSVETPTIDLDVNGVLDNVTNFISDNPLIVGGGVAVLAVPFVVSQLLGNKPKPWGIESAKSAYAKLADDANAQLLDIRPSADIRQVGSPDIRGLKKKPINVVYKGEDKPGFLKKLSLKFKKPEDTTLFILDKFEGNSELVAELVTANGFKAAYAVKDGAEGRKGWLNSGLPWIQPTKSLNLGLSNLTDAISGVFEEGSITASFTLGLAAATGLGLLAFTEVETILELLGSAALIQLVSKKLLFAEDRKKTLQEVDDYLNTKIAPKELVDDIKRIGSALLPLTDTSKALPVPTPSSDTTVEKGESVSNKEVTQPTSEINSVPIPEVYKESIPVITRSLSPFPNYPDLKPPSSPMPSQP